jgi:hypothetical protein
MGTTDVTTVSGPRPGAHAALESIAAASRALEDARRSLARAGLYQDEHDVCLVLSGLDDVLVRASYWPVVR